MHRLYDYAPSLNCWKIRELFRRLKQPLELIPVSIFTGEGQTPEFLKMNPTGAVPVMVMPDGSTVAESNAILVVCAEGTQLMPPDTAGAGQDPAVAVLRAELSRAFARRAAALGAHRQDRTARSRSRRIPARPGDGRTRSSRSRACKIATLLPVNCRSPISRSMPMGIWRRRPGLDTTRSRIISPGCTRFERR